MKGTILVTDSLFIHAEHEQAMRDAGYEIERLDKPQASEEELLAAITGKIGYILGGVEVLTDKVIDAADQLKAVVFTGIGYKHFIPNYEYVTKKGIAIGNTPDGPTHAVAEWAMTMALAMNRNIFELGLAGEKSFMTSKGIESQRIGIIGLGRIGKEIANMLKPFKPASVSYYNRHRHEDIEKSSGLQYKEMPDLLKESDIVFVCVSSEAGDNFIGENELASMPDGSLLVTFMQGNIVDYDALLKELKSGRIRAASDHPMKDPAAKELPLSNWYCFNGSNAFNSVAQAKLTSDMATKTMLNLLETGNDEHKVN